MGNNEMMLGVDGTLNIVPDHPAASPTCGHRARIGISQRYLLVHAITHPAPAVSASNAMLKSTAHPYSTGLGGVKSLAKAAASTECVRFVTLPVRITKIDFGRKRR